jgi:kynurenine formamidase
MTGRIIDLSMEVHGDMPVYPGVTRPKIETVEDHRQYARTMGTDVFGVKELASHSWISTGDHVGTHMDSWWHFNPDKSATEEIPLDYCYGDAVVLDFSAKGPGDEITEADVRDELKRIEYQVKPRDIVLIRTDAAGYCNEERYLTDHPGMSCEATVWLLDQGVKVMGIDAIGFDIPVRYMFERKKFWESHRVMLEREYYHLENMSHLDQIPRPYGFKVAVFPVKWRGASAGPVRAVAIIE